MRTRIALAVVAISVVAALSAGVAAASGLAVVAADPPFTSSVDCPPAAPGAEGTVPCG